jgi:DnaA family protein
LSEDAALYLVHRLPRDMHSLFAVLDQLDEASLVAQRTLTVPFLRNALEKGLGDRG